MATAAVHCPECKGTQILHGLCVKCGAMVARAAPPRKKLKSASDIRGVALGGGRTARTDAPEAQTADSPARSPQKQSQQQQKRRSPQYVSPATKPDGASAPAKEAPPQTIKGQPLASESAAEPEPAFVQKICPKCRTPVPNPGQKFCDKCGLKLPKVPIKKEAKRTKTGEEEENLRCRECGYMSPPSGVYCRNCGIPLPIPD